MTRYFKPHNKVHVELKSYVEQLSPHKFPDELTPRIPPQSEGYTFPPHVSDHF